MRKVTKSAIVCDKCGSALSNEEYDSFCDYCKQKIGDEKYEITVFWKDESGRDAAHVEFDSLKCAREWLKKFPWNKERVSFIDLPYIHDLSKLAEFIGD